MYVYAYEYAFMLLREERLRFALEDILEASRLEE